LTVIRHVDMIELQPGDFCFVDKPICRASAIVSLHNSNRYSYNPLW
jgi:hypothetical protein